MEAAADPDPEAVASEPELDPAAADEAAAVAPTDPAAAEARLSDLELPAELPRESVTSETESDRGGRARSPATAVEAVEAEATETAEAASSVSPSIPRLCIRSMIESLSLLRGCRPGGPPAPEADAFSSMLM